MRQRIALAIAIAVAALVLGRGVEQRFFAGRGGWSAYTPNTAFYDLPGGHGDILLATAWWLLVITMATLAALWVLREPPRD